MQATGETQKLTTDPEARMMRTKDGFACCYNVQAVVEQSSHLIVDYEVSNSRNDCNSLAPMAQKAKAALETDTLHVLGDKGYDDRQEIEQCVMNEAAIMLVRAPVWHCQVVSWRSLSAMQRDKKGHRGTGA